MSAEVGCRLLAHGTVTVYERGDNIIVRLTQLLKSFVCVLAAIVQVRMALERKPAICFSHFLR